MIPAEGASFMETPPLVGRELDLAVALEQLKRIQLGVPASLLVRGEAGIGKSRLVAELADRARALGYVVAVGRADELDRGIPYAVFRDVLARLSHDGSANDVLGALIEDLRATVDGGARGQPAEDDEGELTRVFASGVRLFRGLAARAPTVLVVEDLHLADRESLALVALVARLADVPMLTVVTLRPGEPASSEVEPLMERLTFDGRGATIDLEPLDRHETRALVAAVLSAVPDDQLGDAVFAASRGNPFFAREVVQLFAEGAAVEVDKGKARLVSEAPEVGLRPSTALLRRLFGGTSGDVELAKVMAVFGRFALRHLALVERLTGQTGDEVTASFDRLVKAGLIVPGASGGYEFTHSIVRNTLYDDIGPAERRRIHAAIAAELAKDRRAGFVLDILELATHVAESAEPGDDSAAEVLLEAGAAVAGTAPLVSAEYQRRAIELLPLTSPARADALARQTRSLHVGCRPAEAAVVGRQALATLPAGPVRPTTVAIVVSDLYLGGLVDEALDVLEPELTDDGAAATALVALKVNLLFQAGRAAEAAGLLAAALPLGAGPPSAQLMAATHLVQYANHVGKVDVAADLLRQLAELERRASPTVALALHEFMAFGDWRPGLVARMEQHLAAARALRQDAESRSIGGGLEAAQLRWLLLRGRWDEGLELIRSAGFDLEQRGVVVGSQLLLCAGCEVLIDRGALDEAAEIAGRLVTPIESLRRNVAYVRARLHRAVGDRTAAMELLARERDRSARGGTLWMLSEVLRELVDVHLEEGRSGAAQEATAELEQLAETVGWPEARLPALRARAVVYGDVDAARGYAELAESEGWEVERAHAALVLGELDEDPGHNLTQAYKLFDTWGAAPLRRRAAAGLRSRGLTVPRRSTQPSSELTETEVQLIRLVRQSLSNQQIATAMHYSTKTIEVYLSRIYVKTGCASRLELIRAVDTGALSLSD
jgi:DNA-binding CsgD family transcriptional regulator